MTETSTLATLLVSCHDRRGIVAALTMILLAGAAAAQPFGPASPGTFVFDAPTYERQARINRRG